MTRKTSFGNDLRAEVGVGTMIVFIASILVAAIAAGVLISTSQKLQAKSLDTGNQATQNVVGTMSVLYIQGVRSGTTSADLIDQLDLTVKLAAGANPVDTSTIVFYIHDGTTETVIDTCNPGGAVSAANEFAMTIGRGDATDCGNMASGDLVYFHLGLAGGAPIEVIPGGIAENAQITMRIVPQHGNPVLVALTVPAFGSGASVVLW